ncbi:lipopolysaccharide biosynthesis protein [Vibrio breoganii]
MSKKTIRNNVFIKNIISLATGTVIAQIITLVCTPVITRVYGPDAFGMLGQFTAVTNILMPISAFCLPIGIITATSILSARNIAYLSIILSTLFSLVLMVALLFWIFFAGNGEHLYLLLLPLTTFVSGLQQVGERWMLRCGSFKKRGRISIQQAVIQNGLKVLCGFFSNTGMTLILTFVLSQFTLGLQLMQDTMASLKKHGYLHFYILKKIIVKNKDFPMYRMPQILLSSVGEALPILFFAHAYGAETAGFYTLARTILSTPAGLISKSIGDVYFPKITRLKKQRKPLSRLYAKSTIYLLIIGLIPYSVVYLYGEEIFSLIFGSEWNLAGQYASYLCIWLLFMLANVPAIQSIPVLSIEKQYFKFSCISFILRLASIFIVDGLFHDDFKTLLAYSILGAVLNIGLIVFVYIKSIKNDNKAIN